MSRRQRVPFGQDLGQDWAGPTMERATSMTAAIATETLAGEQRHSRNWRPIIWHNGTILQPVFRLFVNRSLARRSEAFGPARGFAQFLRLQKLCMENRRNDQLGNPLPTLNRK